MAFRSVTAESDDRKGIKSLETGIAVAQVLAQAGRPLTAREIAGAMDMAANKLNFYLISLERIGLLTSGSAPGTWDLGELALELGLEKLRRLDVVGTAEPTLEALRQAYGYPIYLTVWGNRGPAIIRWLEGAKTLPLHFQTGSVLPLLATATGRVFLAFLPESKTAEVREEEWRAFRPGGDYSRFHDEVLAPVRAARVAVTAGEIVGGIGGVAAPILGFQGQILAALTLVGPTQRVDMTATGPIAAAVREAGIAVSRRMGHREA